MYRMGDPKANYSKCTTQILGLQTYKSEPVIFQKRLRFIHHSYSHHLSMVPTPILHITKYLTGTFTGPDHFHNALTVTVRSTEASYTSTRAASVI